MARLTFLWCLAALALTSATGGQDVDEEARKAELKKLQGTWIVQSATRDGKERKEETGAVLAIGSDLMSMRQADSAVFMHLELDVQDLDGTPKHIWFRPDPDPRWGAPLKLALDTYLKAGYEVDGDNLKLCFKAAQAWPTEISDKNQVLWVLRRETAEYRREKLDKRLHGKKILHFERAVKEDDKREKGVWFPDCTYLDCKDTHDYFLEPYTGPYSIYNSGPYPKFIKRLHGLRIVQNAKGNIVTIENWYAGEKHGLFVKYQDGKRWYDDTYYFGFLH